MRMTSLMMMMMKSVMRMILRVLMMMSIGWKRWVTVMVRESSLKF